VGQVYDLLHRIDRAHRIRGCADRYELGAIGQLRSQVLHVERAVLDMNVDLADGRAGVARRLDPGRVVRVVFHAREQDLIARPPRARQRAAQGQRERGHVRTEGHEVAVGTIQKIGNAPMSLPKQTVGLPAGRECPPAVGVRSRQVGAHGLDYAKRNLATGRAVHVDRRLAVDLSGERGKTSPHLVDVESLVHLSTFAGK
jgi:hypothetical protein